MTTPPSSGQTARADRLQAELTAPPEPTSRPEGAAAAQTPAPAAPPRRFFRRGPWEMAATILIALGVIMLMQPISIWLYGWSFAVLLTGTIGFIIVSHFPE